MDRFRSFAIGSMLIVAFTAPAQQTSSCTLLVLITSKANVTRKDNVPSVEQQLKDADRETRPHQRSSRPN